MIIIWLFLLGLCLGSFVNALVWRVHQQADGATAKSKKQDDLSILRGRSMCPNCQHTLAAKDLIPVVSWLSTGGTCRYCGKKISIQYPIVELATALVFVASYLFWPQELLAFSAQLLIFALWLVLVPGLMALLVYDLRWYLLPNRIMYPLAGLAALLAVVQVAAAVEPLRAVADTALAVVVGGGLFYVLFQVSKGKWIGGGDVKLGWLLGLILATPGKALLMIFIAALLGTAVSLPLLWNKKLSKTSVIPFGPFLIVALMLVQLFGSGILDWYVRFITMS